MEEKINTHLANDLEQSAAVLDSREFDAVQLDNCASMMRYAATVIRQALANAALDKMAENAREMGLSYEQPAPAQEPVGAIRSLTDQCAALIQERDELQKQVWRYEKNGVTCQTYRHTVEQSCSECNVQMNYTTPPAPAQPLTDAAKAVIDAARAAMDDSVEADDGEGSIKISSHVAASLSLCLDDYDRAIEAAHGITSGKATKKGGA